MDSRHESYGPYSDVTLSIDRVPEEITKRMVKVFSKHSVPDVREWGRLLMKNYQMLHAVEKPMNLQYVKPYANTSDLVNKTPFIHPGQAKLKREEDAKAKVEEAKKAIGMEEGKSTIEMETGEEGFKASDTSKKSKSETNEEAEQ